MKLFLLGVVHLHYNFICHRDLKPSNIYVTTDLHSLKILDFNVALTFTNNSKLIGVTGEERYSAPELT